MSLKWISANHLSVSLLSISSVPESESVVAQSCLTAGNPKDCSPPGSSVHGILQARVLEWVAISFSNYYPYFPIYQKTFTNFKKKKRLVG